LNFDINMVLAAFALTIFAGICTGIGSLIAWFAKKTNTRFLSVVLGFSAGVMIYVSMTEIFTESRALLTSSLGEIGGSWVTVAGFFGGMLIIALIDKFVPAADNPHEMRMVELMSDDNQSEPAQSTNGKRRLRNRWRANHEMQPSGGVPHKGKLMRLGLFTAFAIAIHNFPEGIATFVAALKDPSLGITIAVAIAIHNIPEGIAVSVPVYYASGDRKKAFKWSLLSGLAEPLGALVGFLILMPIMNDIIFGILFACVAGIMVFISLDEILPTAREYGEPHLSIYGMVAGMAVMAVSLLLFL
jgi:ZIP family zinc transporter